MNNLYNVARALLNYEASKGHFPPAYTTDADGRPLHSWRALLLPYLDRMDLYKSIDFRKPWDDPVNAEVFKKRLGLFNCPGFMSDEENKTTYLAVVTPKSWIRTGESRSLSKDAGDPALSLLVIEVDADHAVPWMKPVDADEELILQLSDELRLNHSGGMIAAFADGHVQYLPANLSAEERRALISVTAADDEVIKDRF